MLTFFIGNYVFNTPAFDFSGFYFSLDVNFQLTPCIIGLYGNFTDHDLKVIFGTGKNYGDSAFGASGGVRKDNQIRDMGVLRIISDILTLIILGIHTRMMLQSA